MRRRLCRSISVLAGLLAAGSLTPGCAADAQEQVAAVYKAHDVRFVYHSSVNLFACDELRNHVYVIMRAVGARDDLKVRVTDCDVFFIDDEMSPAWDRWNRQQRYGSMRSARQQHSSVRVQLMLPIEATPDVLAEVDKDKSRRELISRVTGDPLAALNDPIFFPAEHQQVTLSRATLRLGPEDCELLEQMTSTIFRKLNLKVTDKDLSCDPYQRSYFPPKVVIEALLPVAVVAAEKKEKEEEEKK